MGGERQSNLIVGGMDGWLGGWTGVWTFGDHENYGMEESELRKDGMDVLVTWSLGPVMERKKEL